MLGDMLHDIYSEQLDSDRWSSKGSTLTKGHRGIRASVTTMRLQRAIAWQMRVDNDR